MECPVCRHPYDTKGRRPSLTPPCLHTSCSACLRDLALSGGQFGATGMAREDEIPVDRMISCPQCKAIVNTNDIYSDKALMAKLKQKRLDDMPVIDELTLDDFDAALSAKKTGKPANNPIQKQPHHSDPTAAPYPQTPFQQPQPPFQQPQAPLQNPQAPLQHPQAQYPQPQAPLHQPHPHSSHPTQPYLPPLHPQPMPNPGAGAAAIGWGQPGSHNPFDPSLNPSYHPKPHDPNTPTAMGWSVNPHSAGGAATAGAAVGLVAGTAVGTKVMKDAHGKKVGHKKHKKEKSKKEKHNRSSSSDSSSSSSSSSSGSRKHHRRHRSHSRSSSSSRSSGSRKPHHRHHRSHSKRSSGSSGSS